MKTVTTAAKKRGPASGPTRGRNAIIVPPLGVDFDTALSALLRTPALKKAERPPRKRKAKG
jgi:hypothetical protein